MTNRRYIGGAFAAADSQRFYTEAGDWEHFFPPTLNGFQRFAFETGTDALAACISQLGLGRDLPLFVPLHYCAETIARLRLKCPQTSIYRYAQISDIPDKPAGVLWNHFNGYTPPPPALFNGQPWLVIEDYVQAAFDLQMVKGIAAFTSLRKWSEVDVAFLYMQAIDLSVDQNQSNYFKTKKKAEQDKASVLAGDDKVAEEQYLQGFQQAEQALYVPAIYSADPSQIYLLGRIAWTEMLAQRLANTDTLMTGLKGLAIELVETHTLFCMVRVKNRDKLRKTLATQGIFAPVHWLDSQDYSLANSLLSFPIDQRYTSDDMQQILKVLNHALNHKTL